MEILENVNLQKQANIYFDGNVTSRSYVENGVTKSLGIMMPGEYTFGTKDAEHMEIISGDVEILLTGLQSNWEEIKAGGFFEVPANSSFDIKVNTITDYCCTYLK